MKALKKEWDESEIAPQIYLKTRNRAWQKLRQRKRHRRLSLAAVAALAAITASLFLLVRPPAGLPAAPQAKMTNPQTPAAADPEPLEADLDPPPAEIGEGPVRSARKPVFQSSAARQDDRQTEATPAVRPALKPQPVTPAPDRLVMNFRLPQSGVRMIWIKQRTPPQSSGGTGS